MVHNHNGKIGIRQEQANCLTEEKLKRTQEKGAQII